MWISHSYAGFTVEVKNPAILDLEIEMVTSKKPAATKPVDQFISLIKTSDKEEVAAQKNGSKGFCREKSGGNIRKESADFCYTRLIARDQSSKNCVESIR